LSGEPSFIGVLCWESGLVPRGLEQLEELRGNSTNPSTYDCPVVFRRVEGAAAKTILEEPDPAVHSRMLAAAQELCEEGAAAITTSCGFNIILQRRLSEAVPVPVFSSSLMQVPWVLSTLRTGAEVIVMTAKGSALSPEHLSAAGIEDRSRCHVWGLERNDEWNKIFTAPEEEVDVDAIRDEVAFTAETALKTHPRSGAIVLECTDLPPFAGIIRRRTRKPVFDFVTMLKWMAQSLPLTKS
jgi:hypothetical protein